MLEIVERRISRLPDPAYCGNVVSYIHRQAVLHRKPPRAASVRRTADWIRTRAEKVGATTEGKGRASTQTLYAVSLGSYLDLFNRDQLEWRLRLAMLQFYIDKDVVLGIGSPRKVWTNIRGVLLGVGGDGINVLTRHVRHTNGHWILRPSEPEEHRFGVQRVQQIMLYRDYRN